MSFKAFLSTTLMLLMILCSPTTSAVQNIKPFQAIYNVKYHSLPSGTITRTFTVNNANHYEFKAITDSKIPLLNLSINESSQGQWNNNMPQPNLYEYHQTILNKNRDIVVNFDWLKRLALTNKNGRHYSVKIPQDAQDKISYQLSLRQDLLNNSNAFVYHIADRYDVDTYVFKKIGEEKLDTPLGKVQTIKMQRVNTNKKDDIFTFWLAPQYDYLLVKLVDEEDGGTVAEATIKSVTTL